MVFYPKKRIGMRDLDALRWTEMKINYNRLWKLLIDKGLNKTKLTSIAGITTNAVAKMGKNESVQLEVLLKICEALNCTIDDIVEITPDIEADLLSSPENRT